MYQEVSTCRVWLFSACACEARWQGLFAYKAMCTYVIGIFYKQGVEPSINDIIIVPTAGAVSSEGGEPRRNFLLW